MSTRRQTMMQLGAAGAALLLPRAVFPAEIGDISGWASGLATVSLPCTPFATADGTGRCRRPSGGWRSRWWAAA